MREQVWVTRGDGKHGEGEGDKIDSHRMTNGVMGVMASSSPSSSLPSSSFSLRLSACLLVCQFVFLPACMHACLPVWLFVRMQHVCLSACLHVCLSACMFACMSACLLVCLSACQSVCMSFCPYARQSVRPSVVTIPYVFKFQVRSPCNQNPFDHGLRIIHPASLVDPE